MIRILILSMAASLMLTELLELGISVLAGIRDRKRLRIIALANLLTNPVVVMASVLIPRYCRADIPYAALVAALELWAFVTEALIYRKRAVTRHPFLFSAALNLVSFTAGFLL